MSIESRLSLLEARLEELHAERNREFIKDMVLKKTVNLLVMPEKYKTNTSLLHPSVDIDAGLFYEITEHKSNIIGSNCVPISNTIEYIKTKGQTYYMFQTYMKTRSGKLCITSGCTQLYFIYDKETDNVVEIQ